MTLKKSPDTPGSFCILGLMEAITLQFADELKRYPALKGAEAVGLGPPPFDEKRKIENPSFFSVYLWAFPV